MFDRIDGKASGKQTALGTMPRFEDLDWSGSDFSNEHFSKVISFDQDKWLKEINSHHDFFSQLGEKLPEAFARLKEAKISRLEKSGAGLQ